MPRVNERRYAPASVCLVVSFVAVFVGIAWSTAQTTPLAIKVQGYLTDTTGGTPVPANDVHDMVFEIFDAQVGGSQVAAVGPLAVEVSDGRYEAELPLGPSLFEGPTRYLQITINSEVLLPRIKIVSVPYAFRAEQASRALMVEPGSVDADSLAPGAVDTPALAAGAVTVDKLGFSCLTGDVLVYSGTGWACSSSLACASQPAGTVCRAATGPCDLAETCDGIAVTCPEDALQPDGWSCGDTGSECVNQDTCLAGVCQDNGFQPPTTACGFPGDECTNQDFCDGSGACTDHGFVAPGSPCGNSSGTQCTDPDTCDGVGTCIENHAPDGTSCDNSDACSGDTCQSGVCDPVPCGG